MRQELYRNVINFEVYKLILDYTTFADLISRSMLLFGVFALWVFVFAFLVVLLSRKKVDFDSKLLSYFKVMVTSVFSVVFCMLLSQVLIDTHRLIVPVVSASYLTELTPDTRRIPDFLETYLKERDELINVSIDGQRLTKELYDKSSSYIARTNMLNVKNDEFLYAYKEAMSNSKGEKEKQKITTELQNVKNGFDEYMKRYVEAKNRLTNYREKIQKSVLDSREYDDLKKTNFAEEYTSFIEKGIKKVNERAKVLEKTHIYIMQSFKSVEEKKFYILSVVLAVAIFFGIFNVITHGGIRSGHFWIKLLLLSMCFVFLFVVMSFFEESFSAAICYLNTEDGMKILDSVLKQNKGHELSETIELFKSCLNEGEYREENPYLKDKNTFSRLLREMKLTHESLKAQHDVRLTEEVNVGDGAVGAMKRLKRSIEALKERDTDQSHMIPLDAKLSAIDRIINRLSKGVALIQKENEKAENLFLKGARSLERKGSPECSYVLNQFNYFVMLHCRIKTALTKEVTVGGLSTSLLVLFLLLII